MSTPVVCFGELLVRLTATGGSSLVTLPDLKPFVGGAEANVALGLQRLGHPARMISVVPDNELGLAALQELRGKTVVFVQNEQGFQARPVTIGRRAREAVEISEGLAAGERYAAKNSYLVKADVLKGEAEED